MLGSCSSAMRAHTIRCTLYNNNSETTQYSKRTKIPHQVGIIVLQYSAAWSNSAVRFGRLVNQIRSSPFYLFSRPDSAVWSNIFMFCLEL